MKIQKVQGDFVLLMRRPDFPRWWIPGFDFTRTKFSKYAVFIWGPFRVSLEIVL